MDKFVEPLPLLTQGHYIVGDRGKELTLTEKDFQEQRKMQRRMFISCNKTCEKCSKKNNKEKK